MAHVFISYAHKDFDDFVKPFVERLEKAGFDKWIDHEQLAGGNDWTEDIDTGIDEAYGLIVIKSEASSHSDYVKYEWSYALGCGVSVIPILYQPSSKTHIRLETIQHFDFTDSTWPEWDNFIKRLNEIRSKFGTIVRIPLDAPQEVKDGLKELNSSIPQRREDGARHLGRIGNPIAVPGLIIMLGDLIEVVRIAAIESLGTIGDRKAVEPLLDSVIAYCETGVPINPSPLGTYEAFFIQSVIKIGTDAVPTLIEKLAHPLHNVKIVVVTILGKIKDRRMVGPLMDLFLEANDELKSYIIWAIGQTRDTSCVPILKAIQKNDPSYPARIDCSQALLIIGDNEAFEALVEVLKDKLGKPSTAISQSSDVASIHTREHIKVRQSAAYALGDFGDKKAIELLYNVLMTESDQELLTIVCNALQKLVDDNDIDMLIKMMRKSKVYGLNINQENLLLSIIQSINTPDALLAVGQWKEEHKGK